MRGVLPAPVVRRLKSPLTGDPQWQAARLLGLAPLVPAARIEEYVDFVRVPDRADQDMMIFWADLRQDSELLVAQHADQV